MKKQWPALFVLCLLFVTSSVLAGDGRLRWQTIETTHFRIHYPSQLDALAARTALLCEEAYAVLVPLFEHVPSTQIDVAVTDFSDTSNGSASALPVPRINLLAAPPRLDSNLGDQSDWLRLLIFHEFTHILQLDQVGGVPKFLNHLFGRLVASNHNLPSFQLEGGAVWAESVTSGYGRIHSASFRGFLRAQALANRLFDLDEVIHAPLDFPGANVWYMYGGHFTDWVVQRLGRFWMAALHREIGRQFLAFGINRATMHATGERISDLYVQWKAWLTAQANREAETIRKQGETPIHLITTNGRNHKNLRFLKDGTLLALEGVDRELGIYGHSISAPESPIPFFIEENITEFDLCENQERLVYTRSMKIRGAYRYNDLYIFERATGAIRRITTGARLREIHCNQDDSAVIAVQLFQGLTRLVQVSLATGRIDVLHTPEPTGQIAFPLYLSNVRKIIFTQVGPQFGRDLVLLDLDTKVLKRMTQDSALELRPRPGRTVNEVVYTSDRDGVFNAYALNVQTGVRQRLTRVINGVTAVEAHPSNQTLAVIAITADGYDIGTVVPNPKVLSPTSKSNVIKPAFHTDHRLAQLARRQYEPSDRLWPLRWSPAFAFSTATDVANQLGLELEVNDPLNHHAISGTLTANPEENELDASMSYSFRRFVVNYGASISRRTAVNPTGAFYEGERQPERRRVGAATLRVGLPMALGGWSTSSTATYSFSQQNPVLNVDPNHDPLDPPPSTPEQFRSASLSMGISVGATESFFDSISNEKGWVMSGGLRLRRPELGGEDEAVELTYSARTYFDMWFRHVLALKVNGAMGRGGGGRRAFYALSPPPQRPVLLDAFDGIYFGTNFLRGFPSGTVSGDRFVLFSASYRMPIWDIFRGLDAAPIFLRRFKLALFTDWAQAGNKPLTWSEERFARAVGAELVSEATIGWRLPLNVRLGYAHGFKSEGESQLYFYLGNWF